MVWGSGVWTGRKTAVFVHCSRVAVVRFLPARSCHVAMASLLCLAASGGSRARVLPSRVCSAIKINSARVPYLGMYSSCLRVRVASSGRIDAACIVAQPTWWSGPLTIQFWGPRNPILSLIVTCVLCCCSACFARAQSTEDLATRVAEFSLDPQDRRLSSDSSSTRASLSSAPPPPSKSPHSGSTTSSSAPPAAAAAAPAASAKCPPPSSFDAPDLAGKSPDELKKSLRKLKKKLRQIEGLEAREMADLTKAERSKLRSKPQLLSEIQCYETALGGDA